MLDIEKTALPGVLLITPRRHSDDRGFFSESWSKLNFMNEQVDIDFVQDNHSMSYEAETVRGLHFQSPPHAQAKLVRCGRGRLLDVAVDIRRGSPTYGQWISEELSYENGKQMFIPVGFLHGFATREPNTEIIYKCSDYYSPECDGAVRYNDPDIAINWELNSMNPILSEKDKSAPMLRDFESPFTYGS